MLNYFHGDIARATKMAREQGISHTIAEKKVFGVTHAEIGAYLLSLWGLPDSIVEAVAFHHTPRATANPRLGVLTCVHIGNLFEHEQSAHSTQIHDADLDIDYLESLGIADQVSHLRSSCVPETVDAKQ